MRSECVDGLFAVRRLCNQFQVRFRVHQRRNTFSKERMVVDGEDSNDVMGAVHDF